VSGSSSFEGTHALAIETRIKPTYTTQVTVTGGRQGHAVSSDGVLDLQLKMPGASGARTGTNPEQLFAAGYAACFQSALLGTARRAGEDASDSTVLADVALGKDDTGAYGLAVTLTVSIPGLERAKVQELADAAHQTCPYSRATRGNIDVQVTAAV
jgi:lipoyl-dependent peroxiredoxin